MGENTHHLRMITGRPWKQALVCALYPEARYRPWEGIEEVRRGDTAVVVLDTSPATVLCAFTWDAFLDKPHTIMVETFGATRPLRPVAEVEAAIGMSLAGGADLDRHAASRLVTAIARHGTASPSDRTGDSAVAISRILVAADLQCALCSEEATVTSEDELDRQVHTASADDVAQGRDWPALLCAECASAMVRGGFTSVVDFVFSRRPACPVCSARHARRIGYGMPTYDAALNIAPWDSMGGCVIDPFSPQWNCGACGHGWS